MTLPSIYLYLVDPKVIKTMASNDNNSSSSESGVRLHSPVCLIVLGMAGSGKTTFVQRLVSYLNGQKNLPYSINMDPACREVPYPANIGRPVIIFV